MISTVSGRLKITRYRPIFKMQTIWCKKKVLFWCAVGFFLWIFFRTKKYTVKFEAIVSNTKPVEVWEYVSDFSNMKKLNPTILDFTIEAESGNYDHWKYTVHYTELLSHLEFIHNFAEAHFQVRPTSANSYTIESTHRTCFVTSFTCVTSQSEFTFEPVTSGTKQSTKCTETVTYECPIILSKFCEKEVWYQRKAIMANLQTSFKK